MASHCTCLLCFHLPSACVNRYADSSNSSPYLFLLVIAHAGLLVDSIDVFDFAPGEHTFTITVTDTLGSSASDSFAFTTPEALGRHSATIVLWHDHHSMLHGGSITNIIYQVMYDKVHVL